MRCQALATCYRLGNQDFLLNGLQPDLLHDGAPVHDKPVELRLGSAGAAGSKC